MCGALDGVARQQVNADLIAAHWENLLRVAGSLQLGTVSASEFMRTPQAGGRPASLGRTLGELGRLGKMLHLLAYIDGEAYRRRILVQLNTWHFVVPAVRANGTQVVVKAFTPTGEFARQAAALRLCEGRGAARLLAAAGEHEAMLLERLRPGTSLTGATDDDAATAIAVAVMRAYWRPVPPDHPFLAVANWADEFDRLRRHLGGPGGPRPAALVAEARRLFDELMRSAAPPVVLHGDLHHGNILSAGPRGWLAIDPKGLVGEPACEAGEALLWNNLPDPASGPDTARILARRVAQLAAALGVERKRVRRWGLVQGVLAGTWSVGKGGRVGEWGLAHAERLAALGDPE